MSTKLKDKPNSKTDVAEEFIGSNQIATHITPAVLTELETHTSKKNVIGKMGLYAGITGFIVGFLFQTWVATHAYPLNIGGKPYFSYPSFLWVSFECAVLFAAVGMLYAFVKSVKNNKVSINYEDQDQVADFFLDAGLEKDEYTVN